jgi:hypothetical protein
MTLIWIRFRNWVSSQIIDLFQKAEWSPLVGILSTLPHNTSLKRVWMCRSSFCHELKQISDYSTETSGWNWQTSGAWRNSSHVYETVAGLWEGYSCKVDKYSLRAQINAIEVWWSGQHGLAALRVHKTCVHSYINYWYGPRYSGLVEDNVFGTGIDGVGMRNRTTRPLPADARSVNVA